MYLIEKNTISKNNKLCLEAFSLIDQQRKLKSFKEDYEMLGSDALSYGKS